MQPQSVGSGTHLRSLNHKLENKQFVFF